MINSQGNQQFSVLLIIIIPLGPPKKLKIKNLDLNREFLNFSSIDGVVELIKNYIRSFISNVCRIMVFVLSVYFCTNNKTSIKN